MLTEAPNWQQWKTKLCLYPAFVKHRKQQCNGETPTLSCHFSLSWLATRHGQNVFPPRPSRWLRTSLLQVVNVLREFAWYETLFVSLGLCHPQRNQPWLWLHRDQAGPCAELSVLSPGAFQSAECVSKIL